MLRSNLLHISAQKSALSKRQKEFNRLTKKTEQLHQSMHAFRNGFEQLHKRVLKEMHPMFAEINVAKADTVRAMNSKGR